MSELITLQSGQDFAPTDYNEQGKGVPYMTGASCIVEGQMSFQGGQQFPGALLTVEIHFWYAKAPALAQ